MANLGDLFQRTLINGGALLIVALLIAFAQISYVSWLVVAATALLASVALWEYYQISKKRGFMPLVWFPILMAICYIFALFCQFLAPQLFVLHLLPFLLICFAVLVTFIYYIIKRNAPIANIAVTVFGIIYVAVPLGLMIPILFSFKQPEVYFGNWWLAYLIAVTKSTDIGGYFIGRQFGKHKLAVPLSPNKTIEGAIGGMIAAIVVSLVIVYAGKETMGAFPHIPLSYAIWMGLLVGILAELGDLAESLLKRDAEVKDSNTIPAVGGILDMVDSLLFTAPLIYLLIPVLR
jgi:phosphatidate cytidylyltransferase